MPVLCPVMMKLFPNRSGFAEERDLLNLLRGSKRDKRDREQCQRQDLIQEAPHSQPSLPDFFGEIDTGNRIIRPRSVVVNEIKD